MTNPGVVSEAQVSLTGCAVISRVTANLLVPGSEVMMSRAGRVVPTEAEGTKYPGP